MECTYSRVQVSHNKGTYSSADFNLKNFNPKMLYTFYIEKFPVVVLHARDQSLNLMCSIPSCISIRQNEILYTQPSNTTIY
jgi:hypothetical protein